MAKKKEPANPFYVLVVLIGVIFLVTACAYGAMAYRAISPLQQQPEAHPLMTFLDQRGMQLMGVELGLLTVVTLAAMGLDRLRDLREERRRQETPGR